MYVFSEISFLKTFEEQFPSLCVNDHALCTALVQNWGTLLVVVEGLCWVCLVYFFASVQFVYINITWKLDFLYPSNSHQKGFTINTTCYKRFWLKYFIGLAKWSYASGHFLLLSTEQLDTVSAYKFSEICIIEILTLTNFRFSDWFICLYKNILTWHIQLIPRSLCTFYQEHFCCQNL